MARLLTIKRIGIILKLPLSMAQDWKIGRDIGSGLEVGSCSPRNFENLFQDKTKYKVQTYQVETEDGYILTVFRVNLTTAYKFVILANQK